MEKLSQLLRKFLLLFSNSQITTEKERNNIINSIFHWLKMRGQNITSTNKIKIGDIYFFDFGLNILPLMSYKHMGVVIGKKSYYLYVLPITSYVKNVHNRAINQDFIFLDTNIFTFLKQNSVVKTRDVRCMVTNSIDFNIGLISNIVNTEEFSNLKRNLYLSMFNDYAYCLDNLQKENSFLKMQLFIANLENIYDANTIEELENILSIPEKYNYKLSPINETNNSSNICKVHFQLEDEFHQQISKEISFISTKKEILA